jgi:hypothetical protein
VSQIEPALVPNSARTLDDTTLDCADGDKGAASAGAEVHSDSVTQPATLDGRMSLSRMRIRNTARAITHSHTANKMHKAIVSGKLFVIVINSHVCKRVRRHVIL